MNFQTRVNRFPKQEPPEFESTKTEQSGWLPPGKMIERFRRAGVQLADFRRQAYDFRPDQEIPDEFIVIDPARAGSKDIVDDMTHAERIAEAINNEKAIQLPKKELVPKEPEERTESPKKPPEVQP